MEKEIKKLCDEYEGGTLDRRNFLKKLAVLIGSTAAANALLPLLAPSRARAGLVPADDPRLVTGHVNYPGETGNVRAYIARPQGEDKLPGVVIIHENKGLRPHIEDFTRRVAMAGFLAMAPDALTPLGGTPDDAKKATELIRKLDMKATLGNYNAAAKFLKTHSISTGKVGVVGFCWGGQMANQMAVHSPDLTAAVPYYGRQPAAKDVPKIKASLLLHYGGLDKRINKGIPAFEAALKKASVDYRIYMYEGAKHAFNNDARPDRYHREAAQLAWKRTISFLVKKLKT